MPARMQPRTPTERKRHPFPLPPHSKEHLASLPLLREEEEDGDGDTEEKERWLPRQNGNKGMGGQRVPVGVRGTSTQPVKRFSRFHELCLPGGRRIHTPGQQGWRAWHAGKTGRGGGGGDTHPWRMRTSVLLSRRRGAKRAARGEAAARARCITRERQKVTSADDAADCPQHDANTHILVCVCTCGARHPIVCHWQRAEHKLCVCACMRSIAMRPRQFVCNNSSTTNTG